MHDPNATFIHLVDILLCTLILRIIVGWIISYTKLVRLISTIIALISIIVVIVSLQLPFAMIIGLLLIVPTLVVAILSYVPELSRIYQAASKGNLLGLKIHHSSHIIPQLRDTLHEMVQKHRGAIFVFPHDNEADELCSGGEFIDAEVNSSVILSIFDPHCPRHDGAMFIKNGRIHRIGAVLPLASADGTSVEFGTRHLAAIGLSEQCDVDVIVVSEERGVISHVKKGNVKPLDSRNEEIIEDTLRTIIGGRQEEKSKRL